MEDKVWQMQQCRGTTCMAYYAPTLIRHLYHVHLPVYKASEQAAFSSRQAKQTRAFPSECSRRGMEGAWMDSMHPQYFYASSEPPPKLSSPLCAALPLLHAPSASDPPAMLLLWLFTAGLQRGEGD